MQSPTLQPHVRTQVRSVIAGCKFGGADARWRISRASRNGDLPRELDVIVYGIQQCIDRGVLPGVLHYKITHLKPQAMGKLVCDLYYKGIQVSGDVDKELFTMFKAVFEVKQIPGETYAEYVKRVEAA
jgi:hypothetical protein